MLIVETIGRIRREHFVKGKTIKEIVRDGAKMAQKFSELLILRAVFDHFLTLITGRSSVQIWPPQPNQTCRKNAAANSFERPLFSPRDPDRANVEPPA
jgi:hypothetical protein